MKIIVRRAVRRVRRRGDKYERGGFRRLKKSGRGLQINENIGTMLLYFQDGGRRVRKGFRRVEEGENLLIFKTASG